MSFRTDWDVQKYYNPTEPPVRWLLRKQFMEAYKDSFPEEELICLTNVFYNMEFLGCSYNTTITTQVNYLSNEVQSIMEYRKNKIDKIQRSFVRASDAVKGSYSRATSVRYNPYAASNKNIAGPSVLKSNRENLKSSVRTISNDADRELLARARNQPGWRGKLVIFETPECNSVNPIVVCSNAVSRAGLTLKFNKVGMKAILSEYQMLINDEVISTCTAITEKVARADLCEYALIKFKNFCFTIVEKNKFEGETIEKVDATKKAAETNKLAPDNVGAKIMKLMGWSGQGLGKDQDGIEEPIQTPENVNRFGLGLHTSTSNLRKNVTAFFNNYMSNMSTHSLIFSKEFSNEERKLIHEIARKMNLKSKSYGKESARQLIVQRKLTSWEIVEDLLAAGGISDNYTLIKPKLLT